MEEDGTEVDDEEYFQCLESGTVFLLLREDEKWKPRGSVLGSERLRSLLLLRLSKSA